MRDLRLLLILGLGGVLLFLLGLSLDQTGLRLLSKPLPLIALLLWLRLAPADHYRRWISLGLLLSLLGDMLLEWPADLFVFGLGAFLLGHLCFLLAYLGDTRRPALPALDAPASLILPLGWYRPKRVLEVQTDAAELLLLTGVIERGSDFERVTIEPAR